VYESTPFECVGRTKNLISDFHLYIPPYKWQRELDTDDHPMRQKKITGIFGLYKKTLGPSIGELELLVEISPLSSFLLPFKYRLRVTTMEVRTSMKRRLRRTVRDLIIDHKLKSRSTSRHQ
jgi:hypothetical protein